MSDQKVIPENPFVGLRPFESDEGLLFFGRKKQTSELLKRLHRNHFVAIVGSSGSGKSSLIRAGLIPALKAGFLVEERFKWQISIMKPGESPLFNLAKSVYANLHNDFNLKEVTQLYNDIRSRGVEAILELIAKITDHESNFFLLVDQYEEIFRFVLDQGTTDKTDQANEFVNIMLELAQQTKYPIYVVLTMRSDFLGDCVRFQGLPEAMNESQYLVPRLNRQELREVIVSPVRLYGGKINQRLTDHLLNQIQHDQDELPILQHLLMRIWEYEYAQDRSGDLDLVDYHGVKGFDEALSDHADIAYGELDKKDQLTVKWIFQRLTDVDENKRKIRRPARLSELSAITNRSTSDILRLLDYFIRDRRSFLVISEIEDTDDYLIDISHEALIRQWKMLQGWVDQEDREGNAYRSLVASHHQQRRVTRKERSIISQQLQFRKKHNEAWASRYFPTEKYALSLAHLRTSKWKARFELGSVLAIIFISLWFVSDFYNQTQDSKAAQQAAEKERAMALAAQQAAEEQQMRAEEAAARAQQAENAALRAKAEAEGQSFESLKARQAQAQQLAGNEQAIVSLLANRDSLEATMEASFRRFSQQLAMTQEDLAGLLLIQRGKALAHISLKIEDLELKALLANQAFIFFDEYKEDGELDDNIYNALYDALRTQYKKQFKSTFKGDSAFNQYNFQVPAELKTASNNLDKTLIKFSDGSNYLYAALGGTLYQVNLEDGHFNPIVQNEEISFIRLNDFETAALVRGNLKKGTGSQVIDLKQNQSTWTIPSHRGELYDGLMLEGYLDVISSGADNVLLYNTIDTVVLVQNLSPVRHLDLHPGRGVFAAGAENGEVTIRSTSVENAQSSTTLYTSNAGITALKFNEDGTYLAVGNEHGELLLLDWENDINIMYMNLIGFNQAITSIDFDAHGHYLVASSEDGTVKLWDTRYSYNQPVTITDHMYSDDIANSSFKIVTDLDISPDQETFATLSSDGIARFYSLKMENYFDMICESVGRNLTQAEWNKYIGKDIPYEKTCGNID